ncbi:MAG: hypothetical protein M1822_005672 [Bathelium mastoideum]|nr:MAG: hypothetical protein M1822_005672 [Bathelium mastoideum]
MDRLEKVKAENATNDAIQDDVVAQAYVEQFGLETFNRADSTIHADKVSAQTADTFRAAATFLDLLQIFGALAPEIAARSKYANYHALRIVKAIKAGEDPNLSNPKTPPAPTVEDAMDVDANDPDVQIINGTTPNIQSVSDPDHDSAMPVPEGATPKAVSPAPVSPAPDVAVPTDISPDPEQAPPDVVAVDEPMERDRSNSVGGGYFPAAPPTFAPDVLPEPDPPTAPEIPSAPSGIPPTFAETPDVDPSSFYSSAPPPAPAPAPSFHPSAPAIPSQPPGVRSIPSVPSAPPVQSPVPPPAFVPQAQVLPPAGGYRVDEESIASAQKHAKWAMSALNFEDVDTAVKELRIALRSLGAT